MGKNAHHYFVNSKSYFLTREAVFDLLKVLVSEGFQLDYDFKKHVYGVEKGGGVAQLRLPITIKVNQGLASATDEVKYLMLLIQSGSAAVGVFEGSQCLEHKVFNAYMVRKKQGKSQIKHLKTKGKSRAGSRVRLAKTLIFFEDINNRLIRHFEENEFDRIAFSCSKILLPYLFNSKVPAPFDKKDERIYKIPKHLHQPNFEVMLGMQRFLNKGELTFISESPELEAVLNHL